MAGSETKGTTATLAATITSTGAALRGVHQAAVSGTASAKRTEDRAARPTAAATAMKPAASAAAGSRHRERPRAPIRRMSAPMQTRDVPIGVSRQSPSVTRGMAQGNSDGHGDDDVQVKNRRRSSHRSKTKKGAPMASMVTVRKVVASGRRRHAPRSRPGSRRAQPDDRDGRAT